MRRRLSLFVLLASPCVFLASLYLLWVESTSTAAGTSTHDPLSLLDLFGGVSLYGSAGNYGQAAVLVALALFFGAAVLLMRPRVSARLPLAGAGVALLYLALLNAAQLQGVGVVHGAFEHVSVHLAAGAYLGIASAAVAFLAAVGARWEELERRPSVPAVVALALTVGLLAAFILPWLHVHVPRRAGAAAAGYQLTEFGEVLVTFIALLACFALSLWGPGTPPRRRLVAALGLAVLVAGSLATLGNVHWPWEAWLQLGCSLGLVALALLTSRGLRLSLPPVADAAAVAGGSLLVGSMFLPWQKACGDGFCGSARGWTLAQSATAGGLAVILLVLLLGFRHLSAELAVGAAIYVMAAGFVVTGETQLGYGAPLGFAGTALLLLAAARRLGSMPRGPGRLLVRLVPMAVCLGFLAIPVIMMTDKVPWSQWQSPWHWYWLELGAILVGLRLLVRWLSGPKADDELVLLPLALLAVTVFAVIETRWAERAVSWEGWVAIVLCLLLAVLGWLERTDHLEKLRIPEEIWRIDRLPGES